MTFEEQEAALERVYARMPRLECKGLCQQYCGPIPLSEVEYKRMVAHVGHTFRMDRSIHCPLLDLVSGKCTCHPVRPLICRAFGSVDDPLLRCPHGCTPSRWMSNKEFGGLVAKVGEIVDRGKAGQDPAPG
jgi:hypothetical protein